jgi:hypothetical protein
VTAGSSVLALHAFALGGGATARLDLVFVGEDDGERRERLADCCNVPFEVLEQACPRVEATRLAQVVQSCHERLLGARTDNAGIADAHAPLANGAILDSRHDA